MSIQPIRATMVDRLLNVPVESAIDVAQEMKLLRGFRCRAASASFSFMVHLLEVTSRRRLIASSRQHLEDERGGLGGVRAVLAGIAGREMRKCRVDNLHAGGVASARGKEQAELESALRLLGEVVVCGCPRGGVAGIRGRVIGAG